MRQKDLLVPTLLALATLTAARPALAVFWNDDPNFGVASSTGLTDKGALFANDFTFYNDNANVRGTTILLNSEWALTVHHVVQSSAGYNPISGPGLLSVYVDGIGGYFADQVFVPSDGSEIALVHLQGGVNGATNLVPDINTSTNEVGRIVEIGGYGYYGYVDTTGAGGTVTGTTNTNAAFHRAFNVIANTNSLGQLQITQNNDAVLRNDGVLEGMAGSGDSGGPMFAFYGTNFATQQNDPTQWKLVGLTATSGGPTQGQSSQYTRIANYANWITTTMASVAGPGKSSTGPWIQDSGNNLYDTGGNKFSVSNSTAAPVAHASFGLTNNAGGYTLAHLGDHISMTATLDTPLAMASIQFRFGMFDDVHGSLPGNITGGTAWNGYLVTNSVENDTGAGLYKKGANGGGPGSWWSVIGSNASPLVGGNVHATGSYSSATTGNDNTPAGEYALSLTYTRVATGLEIDWTMSQIADSSFILDSSTGLYIHNPTSGVYSFTGSVIDTNPADPTYTYDQLGFLLYGGAINSTNSTIDISNLSVTSNVPEPTSLLAAFPALLLLLRRRSN